MSEKPYSITFFNIFLCFCKFDWSSFLSSLMSYFHLGSPCKGWPWQNCSHHPSQYITFIYATSPLYLQGYPFLSVLQPHNLTLNCWIQFCPWKLVCEFNTVGKRQKLKENIIKSSYVFDRKNKSSNFVGPYKIKHKYQKYCVYQAEWTTNERGEWTEASQCDPEQE